MEFRWLHLSDIHVGALHHAQLWPRFKTTFHDDVHRLLEKCGDIDVIVFSGDLVNRGEASEFETFNRIISDVVESIARRQQAPQIVTVPGNHDLVRPEKYSPFSIALENYWDSPQLREMVWSDKGHEYISGVSAALQNYSTWQQSAIEAGLHVRPVKAGLLPGDASYVVEKQGQRLGLTALNSTWLQLGAGNYEGKLHVDTRQLLSITDGNPSEWVGSNDVNLLITHHPANWLHPGHLSTWADDVSPTGRFDAHLYGHMHKPDTMSSSRGGGPTKREMQAASLFGLETYGDGAAERIQGYAASEISFSSTNRTLKHWPRVLIKMSDGRHKLVQDSAQDLDESSGSFAIEYRSDASARTEVQSVSASAAARSEELEKLPKFELESIQRAIGMKPAHSNVRRIEQQTCLSALRDMKVVWLVADWGMGEDGFIASVRDELSVREENVYAIDFSGYEKGETFFDLLRARLGFSFQEVCRVASEGPKSILILDDVDTVSTSNSEVLGDLEALVTTVSEFAPNLNVVISTRKRVRGTKFPVIELLALDEADVAVYARESELGEDRYGKPDAASILYRHTDGVPTRLDASLRDLEFMSLSELISVNPDFSSTSGAAQGTPPALVTTISELEQSEDRYEQRAYNLLLALSALPQGEKLTRLKRFLGPHPIGATQARELAERSLISTLNIVSVDGGEDGEKALVVPKPVRNYIRESISPDVEIATDRRALELYFGSDWESGSMEGSPVAKRAGDALCNAYEIQNANTLLIRNLKRSLETQSSEEAEAAIRLAMTFIRTLSGGDHFRSAASLADDVRKVLAESKGFEKERTAVNYEYARSLRMTGRNEDARAIFEGLDLSHLTNPQKQQAELGHALCLEKLGDPELTATVAKRAIAIDKSSLAALQARSILADQIVDQSERRAELNKLLSRATKRKASTIVSNILLDLAKEQKQDNKSSIALLRRVIDESRKSSDHYNVYRAVINIASLPNAEAIMTAKERAMLIEAYHFLYNERLLKLFNRCHEALWRVFEHDGDTMNLLNLFRRSSFIWRLNGNESEEREYLGKLMTLMGTLIVRGLSQADRDGAYFIVRATIMMGDSIVTNGHELDEGD